MRKAIARLASVMMLAGVILAFGGNLSAQVADGGDSGARGISAAELETVTVTSTRVERSLFEVPLAISVVSDREIKDKPLSEPLGYIRDLPGVLVSNTNNFQPRFSLRGYGSDRTMILIDGVRQRAASALVAEESGAVDVDPSEIERIEVIKGPASALYGSDAIGGVINIITKGAPDRPIGASAEILYDGSSSALAPKISIYGRNGGFWLRASGSTLRADDMRLPNGLVYHHTGKRKDIFSLKLGYEWEGGRAEIFGGSFNGWRNLPGINSITAKQADPEALNLPGDPRYPTVTSEWRRQGGVNLSLANLSETVERVLVSLFVIEQEVDLDDKFNVFRPDGTLNIPALSTLQSIDKANSIGGSVQADLTLPYENRLTLGVDYQNNEAESSGVYDGFMKMRGLRNEARKAYNRSLAFFAQDEWRIKGSLALTVGLRYTMAQGALTKDLAYPQRVSKQSHENFVSSFGLVYTGIEGLSLRALYSQGFRAPTLSAIIGKTQVSIPNPDLKPETSDNFEIGARYANYGLSLDLTLFYSVLDNPFQRVDSGIAHPYLAGRNSQITINARKVKSYGAEFYAAYEIERLSLTPFVSLTAMTYERTDEKGRVTDRTGVPSGWGSAGLRFDRNVSDRARLFSEASATWSAGFSDEGDRNLAPSATGDLYYASGWKSDLTFGLEYGEERKTRMTLSFKNIGDRTYEPLGYYQPGFHVVGSLAYEF